MFQSHLIILCILLLCIKDTEQVKKNQEDNNEEDSWGDFVKNVFNRYRCLLKDILGGDCMADIRRCNCHNLVESVNSKLLSEVARLRIDKQRMRRKIRMLGRSYMMVLKDRDALSDSIDIVTRGKFQTCSKEGSNKEYAKCGPDISDHVPFSEETKTRFIVVPHGTKDYRQIYIHSNNLKQYEQTGGVTAMTYIPKSRKVLIATDVPEYIFLSSLDLKDRVTLLSGVYAVGLAVDDERDLVFISTMFAIKRMSTDGKDFSTVRILHEFNFAFGITVDVINERIYVCVTEAIIILKYDGTSVQVLATGIDIRVVTLDNNGNLYYNDDTMIRKIESPTDKHRVSKVVAKLGGNPENLLYYKDSFYCSIPGSNGNGKLKRIDVSKDYMVTTLQITESHIIMCLVP